MEAITSEYAVLLWLPLLGLLGVSALWLVVLIAMQNPRLQKLASLLRFRRREPRVRAMHQVIAH